MESRTCKWGGYAGSTGAYSLPQDLLVLRSTFNQRGNRDHPLFWTYPRYLATVGNANISHLGSTKHKQSVQTIEVFPLMSICQCLLCFELLVFLATERMDGYALNVQINCLALQCNAKEIVCYISVTCS